MTTGGGTPETLAPPPVPADIGVVAALSIEINPFLTHLKNVRKLSLPRHAVIEGEYAGRLLCVIICGPGRPAARRATQLLLDGHRPQWLISPGFAGGLDLDLRRLDVLMASEIVDTAGGRWPLDPPAQLGGKPVAKGRLLTVDQVVRTAQDKAALREQYGARMLDMESAAIADLCQARAVRFLGLRVVSDDAHKDLPPEILSILGQSGGFRLGATLGAIWHRPASFWQLLELREQAHQAADRLCDSLRALVKELR